MVDVVQLFLDELPSRLAALHNLLEQQNFPELARLAHQLKGAGGSYGFPQLTPLAAQLEQLAKIQADETALRAALDKLIEMTEQLRASPNI